MFAAGALLGAVAGYGRAAHRSSLPARSGGGRLGTLGAAAAHHPHPAGPPQRRAIAAWSAAGASAGASGFAVGGVITALASWRLIFWAYLPLAAALTAAVMRAVPHDRGPSHSGSLNTLAAAVFTAAVMAVVVGTTVIARPGQRPAGRILLLAVPLTALFIRADRRAAAPFLPATALRIPPLRRGAAGAFLNTAATSSAMTLATLYLQDTLHRSPLQAAAMLVPFSLAVVAGSALAAPALRRIGPQPALATGLAVIAVANAVLTVAAPHPWALSACAATAGAGLGLSSVAATTLGTTVPEALRGTASGIINTATQLGTAVGIAALLLIADATTGAPGPGAGAPVIAWAAPAALATAGALASPGRRGHPATTCPAARQPVQTPLLKTPPANAPR